jgi:hypothetical protein
MQGDAMTFDTPLGGRPCTANPHRPDFLKEIARIWSRLSPEELDTITTNDQLVHAVMKKYGIRHEPVQRDINTLMARRNPTPERVGEKSRAKE